MPAAPPAEGFVVQRENREGRAVLQASGELDLATAPILEDAISHVEREGDAPIVVDLGDVSFLDCAALWVLVRAHGRATENGGDLTVLRPREEVRKVLQITDTTYLVSAEDSPPRRSERSHP